MQRSPEMKNLQSKLLAMHENGEHPVYHIQSLISEIHMMGKFARSAMRDLGYNVKNHPDGRKDDPFGLHRSISYFERLVEIYMGTCEKKDHDERVTYAMDRCFIKIRENTLIETIIYFGAWCQPGTDEVEAYLTLIAYLNDPRLTYLAIYLLVRYRNISSMEDEIEFEWTDVKNQGRLKKQVIELVVDYLNDGSPFYEAASFVLYQLKDRRVK
jgi:hypothetical protein